MAEITISSGDIRSTGSGASISYWITNCRWCGFMHTGQCPCVKAIEYYPDGVVKRVEFHDTAFRMAIDSAATKLPDVTSVDSPPGYSLR